jgi:hypothetical protein
MKTTTEKKSTSISDLPWINLWRSHLHSSDNLVLIDLRFDFVINS